MRKILITLSLAATTLLLLASPAWTLVPAPTVPDQLNAPVISAAAHPDGDGAWLLAADGGIFTAGSARFYGSTGDMVLVQPAVSLAATPAGDGYWFVALDGGIFSFGGAEFFGSMGGQQLNAPVFALAPTPTGNGYWAVAKDGGIFGFGDARFHGSTGDLGLTSDVVGMAATPDGGGYWLLTSDGAVYAFGNAPHLGSAVDILGSGSAVALLSTPDGAGYHIVASSGDVFHFGSARDAMGRSASTSNGIGSSPVVGAFASGFNVQVVTAGGVVATADSAAPANGPSAPNGPTNPIAKDIFERINGERAHRGLSPLTWDADLAAVATSWSGHMSSIGQLVHGDLAGAALALPSHPTFAMTAENIFFGPGSHADAGSAHVAFMNSDSHRNNILIPELDRVGIGVACVDGALWVTEGFAVSAGNPAGQAHPTPIDPIARPGQAGPSC